MFLHEGLQPCLLRTRLIFLIGAFLQIIILSQKSFAGKFLKKEDHEHVTKLPEMQLGIHL